jgi:hypothetical protein
LHHTSYLTRDMSSTRTILTSNTTKKAHTHTTKTHRNQYFFLFFLARSRLLILPTLELSILLLHSSALSLSLSLSRATMNSLMNLLELYLWHLSCCRFFFPVCSL